MHAMAAEPKPSESAAAAAPDFYETLTTHVGNPTDTTDLILIQSLFLWSNVPPEE